MRGLPSVVAVLLGMGLGGAVRPALAGGEDYLLKVYARDIEDYELFLLSSLTRTKGIDKVRTMFVLSTLKRETAIPLGGVPVNGKAKGPNGGKAAPKRRRARRR
mgnify:CR=1 FL=1